MQVGVSVLSDHDLVEAIHLGGVDGYGLRALLESPDASHVYSLAERVRVGISPQSVRTVLPHLGGVLHFITGDSRGAPDRCVGNSDDFIPVARSKPRAIAVIERSVIKDCCGVTSGRPWIRRDTRHE